MRFLFTASYPFLDCLTDRVLPDGVKGGAGCAAAEGGPLQTR